MSYGTPVNTVDTDSRHDLASGETTMTRREVTATTISSSNGNLRLTYFRARKTETVTQVRTVTGTAAVGASLARIGVYEKAANGDLTLVASIADDHTNLWIAANTRYTSTLSGSFAKKRGVWYAVGTLVVGTSTAPTFAGSAALSGGEAFIDPVLAANVPSQADLPSNITVASLASSGNQIYAALLP